MRQYRGLVPSQEPPPGVQGRHSVPELHLCVAAPLLCVQHSLPKGIPAIFSSNFVATLKIMYLDTSHQYSQGPPHRDGTWLHSDMLLLLSGEGCRGSTRSLHQVSRGDTLCHTGTLLCYHHLNTGTLLAGLQQIYY